MGRYKLVKDEDGNTTSVVINDGTHPNLAVGTIIPNDTDNRHWNEYVEWEESDDADAADTIDYMAQMRSKRDGRLQSCDWTVLSDSPLAASLQADYEAYRQDLRDVPQDNPSITTKAGYDAITWPSEPA